jgi:hypothetical protein
MLAQMSEIQRSIDASIEAQSRNVESTVSGIRQFLEERAIGLGTVTIANMQESLQRIFRDSELHQFLTRLESRFSAAPLLRAMSEMSLPEDFSFPKCSVQQIWALWCMGNESRGLPPLRNLTPSDLGFKNLTKRLSDLRFLMNKIKEKAVSLGIDTNSVMTE